MKEGKEEVDGRLGVGGGLPGDVVHTGVFVVGGRHVFGGDGGGGVESVAARVGFGG